MNIRHIESSRSSSYNEMDDDQISLSKSINNEDSKERELDQESDLDNNAPKIKTMEISRSKYEGKALKSKRNSTKMSKTKDKDQRGIIGKL